MIFRPTILSIVALPVRQQVTWKSPIFFAFDLLNKWIASGVGCGSTLPPIFAKYFPFSLPNGKRRNI